MDCPTRVLTHLITRFKSANSRGRAGARVPLFIGAVSIALACGCTSSNTDDKISDFASPPGASPDSGANTAPNAAPPAAPGVPVTPATPITPVVPLPGTDAGVPDTMAISIGRGALAPSQTTQISLLGLSNEGAAVAHDPSIVTYTTSDALVATVSSTGLVTAQEDLVTTHSKLTTVRHATITATYNSIAVSTRIAVSTINYLTLSPAPVTPTQVDADGGGSAVTVAYGKRQYRAIGHHAGGFTQDMTSLVKWSIADDTGFTTECTDAKLPVIGGTKPTSGTDANAATPGLVIAGSGNCGHSLHITATYATVDDAVPSALTATTAVAQQSPALDADGGVLVVTVLDQVHSAYTASTVTTAASTTASAYILPTGSMADLAVQFRTATNLTVADIKPSAITWTYSSTDGRVEVTSDGVLKANAKTDRSEITTGSGTYYYTPVTVTATSAITGAAALTFKVVVLEGAEFAITQARDLEPRHNVAKSAGTVGWVGLGYPQLFGVSAVYMRAAASLPTGITRVWGTIDNITAGAVMPAGWFAMMPANVTWSTDTDPATPTATVPHILSVGAHTGVATGFAAGASKLTAKTTVVGSEVSISVGVIGVKKLSAGTAITPAVGVSYQLPSPMGYCIDNSAVDGDCAATLGTLASDTGVSITAFSATNGVAVGVNRVDWTVSGTASDSPIDGLNSVDANGLFTGRTATVAGKITATLIGRSTAVSITDVTPGSAVPLALTVMNCAYSSGYTCTGFVLKSDMPATGVVATSDDDSDGTEAGWYDFMDAYGSATEDFPWNTTLTGVAAYGTEAKYYMSSSVISPYFLLDKSPAN